MPDTMELVRTAVRDEALKRGLADPTFADLADLAKVAVGEDGHPKSQDVLEAVSSLRKTKPHLFKSATQLTDAEFKDLTDTLRERRSMHPEPMPDGLKRVNASKCDPNELRSLHAVITGVATWHDKSVVEEVAGRQGITLKLDRSGEQREGGS